MIAVLLIFFPVLAGLLTFFIKEEKAARAWSFAASLITLGIAIAALKVDKNLLEYQCEWLQPLGSSFDVKLDGMGLMLCLLNAVAYPLVFLGTWHSTYKNAKNFFALMLLAQAGMMGVFVAMDALLFYFFWELALIPMYFLCSMWGGERRIRVTFKFFIYTFLGSLLMLIGIIYLQSKTSDHSFSIRSFYSLALTTKNQSWVFWLFLLAFAIKMPVFPLHTWQPDTYEQAPTATTMILSGVMVKMGLLGAMRWLVALLPAAAWQWSDFITPLALIGLIYASLIAIRQDDIKRLVAYSSIAHIGLMCAAIFTNTVYGLQGVMIQMFSHGVNIIGLWIIVEIIERRYGTRKLSELGGLAQRAPFMAVAFVTIALANIALPLTNAFVGEFLMFNGLLQVRSNYYMWFTVMAGMGVILSAVYTLRMVRKIFYGETNALTANGDDLRIGEKLSLGIIIVLIFWMGLFPQQVLDLTHTSATDIFNRIDAIKYSGQK
jgi:NADH-quinone oxidoreductase subunit M